MKYPTMKCARWHVQSRGRLIGVTAAMLFFVLSAQAQDRKIPPVGGPGGGEFVARCPAGQLLAGVQLRVGDDVDGIRPLCRTPSVRLVKVNIQPGDSQYDPKGSYFQYEYRETYEVSDATAITGWYGGPGGGIKTLVCDPGGTGAAPIVSGIYVEAEGEDTIIVNRITLLCEDLTSDGLPTQFRDRKFWTFGFNPPSLTFEAPKISYSDSPKKSRGTSLCPVSRDNLATLAVGIHGKSGIWLDSVGLICDEPKLHLLPRPKLLGRVGPSTGVSSISICDSARKARARNSPAAPGLEAQCRAAGAAGEIPPKPALALGRVKLPSTGAPPVSICDSARGARERNSPAAPGLEAQCRASYAAKGAAIAEVDPIVAAARTVETDALYRQGFDIATGIFGDPALGARGNTATGPGSLGIRDALSAAGQRGFNASVTLHLSRDYKP